MMSVPRPTHFRLTYKVKVSGWDKTTNQNQNQNHSKKKKKKTFRS